MAKQQLNQRKTKLQSPDVVGEQYEQVLTVDDLALPSPQELELYKAIDERIIDFLLETSRKEQEHRHNAELRKIEIIKNSEKSVARMNWWGMFFAFLALAIIFAVAALALYLDHQWFAGVMGTVGVVGVLSVFTDAGRKKDNT